ncbi:class I SAM-dependent methyltransferase [Paramicrobacterium chengjingii]|uniref:Class I SAM-dependent methyltransferase n=1 Tax=Paramicrobacterium chengjingii TaxID=2769067 RepID=A0ABX6YI78_9MICO|nr:class I SAM-dependent methyltransferase [Microbacterium chengjingii]QPZ38466.1 class I SAM-dependent methyltransferase [Microbacterium chengjingii]
MSHHTALEHSLASHHEHPAALAELLERDAAVAGGYLDDASVWISEHVDGEPEQIVDLGAGTGVGTFALARRFSAASVLAVDASRTMLDHVTDSATAAGLEQWVRTVECDLNASWPDAAAGADLVWASSSLHELSDPDRVLRDAFEALRPGGLLVAIEMDVLPSFLPAEFPPEAPGLELRLHAELTALGWNAQHDWESNIAAAGFTMLERRQLITQASAPTITPYAHAWLAKMRGALVDRLTGVDLAVLTALLDDDAELARIATTIRGSRTALLARRAPAADQQN